MKEILRGKHNGSERYSLRIDAVESHVRTRVRPDLSRNS